jgi:hypothetical protein
MKPSWRIYYDDVPPFDSLMGDHWDAPWMGVQAVVQWNPESGREIMHGRDVYYWMSDLGLWWAGDDIGYKALLAIDRAKLIEAPKFGRNSREYQVTLNAVVVDRDFDPAERFS